MIAPDEKFLLALSLARDVLAQPRYIVQNGEVERVVSLIDDALIPEKDVPGVWLVYSWDQGGAHGVVAFGDELLARRHSDTYCNWASVKFLPFGEELRP